jgi:hypothetical protein
MIITQTTRPINQTIVHEGDTIVQNVSSQTTTINQEVSVGGVTKYSFCTEYFDDGQSGTFNGKANSKGNYLYGLLDDYTGENTTWKRATTKPGGSAITDDDIIPGIGVYRKKGSYYYLRVFERANFLWWNPSLDETVDNTEVYEQARSQAKKLFLPEGRWKIDVIEDNAGITIEGVKPYWNGVNLTGGTVIIGKISIRATGVEVYNLGFENLSVATGSNGIEVRSATLVGIENCLFNVYNHGVLIEEYGTTVSDITVKDCDSFFGIHGFVSKAKRVKFINCRSFNASQDGFALVSDNITGVSAPSQCLDNSLTDCEAHDTNIGFNIYSRDYFSTNNSNNITLRDLVLTNCKTSNVIAYGYSIGDSSATPAGRTYNDVKDVSILGCISKAPATWHIKFGKCDGVTVVGSNLGPMDKTTDSKNLKFPGNNNASTSFGDVSYNEILQVNSATPNISTGETYFETANTASTVITAIQGGKVGQVIKILINDDNTVIARSSNLEISRYVRGTGSYLELKLAPAADKWVEVINYSAQKTQFWPYSTGVFEIDFRYSEIATSYITGNITQLTFTNMLKNQPFQLVLQGSLPAGHTITGWDSRILWLNGAAPGLVTDSTFLTFEFYYDGINIRNISRHGDVPQSRLYQYAIGSNSAITTNDTIYSAFGKVQAQINAKVNLVTGVTNFNTPTGQCFIIGDITATNGPYTGAFFQGYQVSAGSGYIIQTLFNNDGEMFTRSQINGTWGSWITDTQWTTQTLTSNNNLAPKNRSEIYLNNTNSGALTQTMASDSRTINGVQKIFKNTGSNGLTVACGSGVTFDGSNASISVAAGTHLHLVATAANTWVTVLKI